MTQRVFESFISLVSVLLVFVLLPGCSGDDFPIAPVSGQVTLDGKPLPNVTVSFQPMASGNASAGVGSSGITGTDGRFTLTQIGGKPGAVVGKHAVRFSSNAGEPAPDSDAPTDRSKDPIPNKYQKQPLTFDVPASGSDKADFALATK